MKRWLLVFSLVFLGLSLYALEGRVIETLEAGLVNPVGAMAASLRAKPRPTKSPQPAEKPRRPVLNTKYSGLPRKRR